MPRADAHLLAVIVFGLAGIVAFHFVASMIRGHLLIHLRTVLDSRLSLGLLDHLLQLPFACHARLARARTTDDGHELPGRGRAGSGE